MSKPKIVIDPRSEIREPRAKVDNVVEIENDEFMAELDDAMFNAGWCEDPGQGKAVLLADGRELVNPTPVAPPAHIAAYSAEASVNDLVQRALARHMALLKPDDEVDTEEDLDDFPEDEDYHPITGYEVVLLRDEAPAIPAAAPAAPAAPPKPSGSGPDVPGVISDEEQ